MSQNGDESSLMFPLITKCLHPLSLHGEQQKSIKVKCESSIPTTSYRSQWLLGAASPTTQRPRCPGQHPSTHFRHPFIQRCFRSVSVPVCELFCAEKCCCASVSGHFFRIFCGTCRRKEVPPIFCHGALRGITSLIAVEKHHQCQPR